MQLRLLTFRAVLLLALPLGALAQTNVQYNGHVFEINATGTIFDNDTKVGEIRPNGQLYLNGQVVATLTSNYRVRNAQGAEIGGLVNGNTLVLNGTPVATIANGNTVTMPGVPPFQTSNDLNMPRALLVCLLLRQY